MKTMKGFKGLLKRNPASRDNVNQPAVDSPEHNVVRAIKLFCETGSNNEGGEEVLHLPVIVESAESSPAAASDAANQIRTFLGKEFRFKSHVQYNAVMLMRILSEHPGAVFTRNFDTAFVAAVKKLLRPGVSPSVQQILCETLDALARLMADDEGCKELLKMWAKERGSDYLIARFAMRTPSAFQISANGRPQADRRLPGPVELASRIEEARNTAKILLQLIGSTPTELVPTDDLMREFSERCKTASKSLQGYINSDSPELDHDTMATLIDTNEQLSLATSRHQRAVLAARRALATANAANTQADQPSQATATAQPLTASESQAPAQVYSAFAPAPANAAADSYNGYQAPPGPPPHLRSHSSASISPEEQLQNPFADPIISTAPFIEPAHYGWQASTTSDSTTRPPHVPSQSYLESVYSEPAPVPSHLRDSSTTFHPSPVISQASPATPTNAVTHGRHESMLVSPSTPQQRYDEPVVTSAFAPSPPVSGSAFSADSASRNMFSTKSGATSDSGAVEIDEHSEVGRRDREPQRTEGVPAILSP